MPVERLAVRGEGVVEPSVRGGEETPATRGRRQGRTAFEAAGVPLIPVEVLASLVETSKLDQRLDLIGHERSRPWLEDRLSLDELERRLERRDRAFRGLEGELEVSEGRRGDEPDQPSSLRGQLKRPAHRVPRLVRATKLRLSKALERQIVRGEERLA